MSTNLSATSCVSSNRNLTSSASPHHHRIFSSPSRCPKSTPTPMLLHRAFQNLVLNALDAMPAGGTLTLRTADAGDNVRIEVSDTGKGLTPEECSRLFTPYYTTKQLKVPASASPSSSPSSATITARSPSPAKKAAAPHSASICRSASKTPS